MAEQLYRTGPLVVGISSSLIAYQAVIVFAASRLLHDVWFLAGGCLAATRSGIRNVNCPLTDPLAPCLFRRVKAVCAVYQKIISIGAASPSISCGGGSHNVAPASSIVRISSRTTSCCNCDIIRNTLLHCNSVMRINGIFPRLINPNSDNPHLALPDPVDFDISELPVGNGINRTWIRIRGLSRSRITGHSQHRQKSKCHQQGPHKHPISVIDPGGGGGGWCPLS